MLVPLLELFPLLLLLELLLDELEECIPSGFDTEKNYENQLITEAINQWLESLPKEERVLFVKP